MPTISLSMIVRDEEDFLPECLESVRGIVDEIVVVDTGSVDRTVEIARDAGAIVKSFTWTEDFSAARNVALKGCNNDWVLILDADERLSPNFGSIIRSAIADTSANVIFIPLYNASRLDAKPDEILSGAACLGQPILMARLFRLTPGMRWEGALHETINMPESHEIRQLEVDAPIIHFGYVNKIMQSRGKVQRNLKLGEKRCKQQPDNPWAWGLLVKEQMLAKDFGGAEKSADMAWKLVEDTVNFKGAEAPLIELASRRVYLLLLNDKLTTALDCINKALSWGRFHPNLGILRAQLLYRMSIQSDVISVGSDYLAQALSDVKKCLNYDNRMTVVAVVSGASSWNALYWRAVIELLQGKPKVALLDFRSALRENPQYRMAQIGCAEALVATGKATGALKILEPMLSLRNPDVWVLTAAAYEDIGDFDRVVQLIKAVNTAGEADFSLRHRIKMRDQLRLSHSV